MQFDQKRTDATLTLSLTFDEGVIWVSYKHEPPLNLGSRLGYRLSREEATKLAAALKKWVGA